MYVCLFTHHTFCFTLCLIPSFLCTASSHIQSSHRGASKDGPLLLLCLPLLLQQLLRSPSLTPFGSPRRTCYLLSWHSAYTWSSSCPAAPFERLHTKVEFHFPSSESLSPSSNSTFLRKRACFHGTALPNPCSLQSSIH